MAPVAAPSAFLTSRAREADRPATRHRNACPIAGSRARRSATSTGPCLVVLPLVIPSRRRLARAGRRRRARPSRRTDSTAFRASKAPAAARRIGLRISPRRRPPSGHIPISPSVPLPRHPPNGPKDRAHQAGIIRLDTPPYPGAVIPRPSPNGVWPIRRPCPRSRQSRLRAALLPPNTWPPAARTPQGAPPGARAHPAAVLGIRRHSLRAAIAQAGRGGAIASRVRHRHCRHARYTPLRRHSDRLSRASI